MLARDTGRWRLLVVVVIGLWLGSACHHYANQSLPSGLRDTCLPPSRPLTNAERLGAMLSIRVSAFRAAGILTGKNTTLKSLRLPELTDAVDILKTETDPMANSRRRRAAAKLSAYGRESPEIQASLASLLCDHPNDLEAILRFQRSNTRCSADRADIATCRGGDEIEIFHLIGDLGVYGCGPDDMKPAPAKVDDTSPPVHVKATVTVTPNIDWVSKRIDPQRWDRCSLFLPTSPGTYLTTGPFTKTNACPVNPTAGNPPPASSVPPLGSAYSGTLFEYFDCGMCNAVFKNVLTITTVWGSQSCPSCPALSYSVHYDEASADTLAGCVAEADGDILLAQLDEDGGSIIATQSGSGANKTIVVSDKNIALTPPSLDVPLWAVMQTAPAQQEMADELAEVACCLKAEP